MYGRKVSDYHSVDMYALGVIFWELLHPRSTFSISWRHANALPQLELDPLPDPLIKLLTDMLSRVPNSRPSANDVSLELDRLLYDGLGEIMDELEMDDRFRVASWFLSALARDRVQRDRGLPRGPVSAHEHGHSSDARAVCHASGGSGVRGALRGLGPALRSTRPTRSAPSTIASPSLDWGDMDDHLSRAGSRTGSIAGSEQEPMTVEL